MFGNLFKSKSTTKKKLILEESLPGSIASERSFYDSICSWDESSIDIEDKKITITLRNGEKINIKLTDFMRESAMIVNTGILNDGHKLQVVTSENHLKTTTFGSTQKNGCGILFKIQDIPKSSPKDLGNK